MIMDSRRRRIKFIKDLRKREVRGGNGSCTNRKRIEEARKIRSNLRSKSEEEFEK